MYSKPFQSDKSSAKCTGNLLFLILVACTAAVRGDAMRDDAGPSLRGAYSPGLLHLSETHQKIGGIVTQLIQPAAYLPETKSYGKVLLLKPLLDLTQQLQTAASERHVAAAALAAAKTTYRHKQDLFNDQAVARFKLAQSKIGWIAATVRVDQAFAKEDAIRLRAEQNWGKVLTEWTWYRRNPKFTDLIAHKSVLLSVSLSPGQRLPDGTRTVFVHRGAIRSDARRAELISSAPITGEKSQRESYYFRSAATTLRTGMHLYVWIPGLGEARKALRIPATALVWRDGKPWIYTKIAPDSGLRQAVENIFDQDDRWFLAGERNQAAEIVVSGAQTPEVEKSFARVALYNARTLYPFSDYR